MSLFHIPGFKAVPNWDELLVIPNEAQRSGLHALARVRGLHSRAEEEWLIARRGPEGLFTKLGAGVLSRLA